MEFLDHNFTADGDSEVIEWSGRFNCHFAAAGTWGGGTAKLQHSLDGGSTYIDVADASLSADGMVGGIPLPQCKLKINLAGATAPDMAAYVRAVRRD